MHPWWQLFAIVCYDTETARERIAGIALLTPLLRSPWLSDLVGRSAERQDQITVAGGMIGDLLMVNDDSCMTYSVFLSL